MCTFGLPFLLLDVDAGFVLQAVNLAEVVKDSGCDELLSCLIGSDATRPRDAKILHRTTKRVSLTCRLVLTVRKNLIKI